MVKAASLGSYLKPARATAVLLCLLLGVSPVYANSPNSQDCVRKPLSRKPSQAANQDPFADFTLPDEPSAPPSLARRPPPKTFTCQRQFAYQGKILDLDSNLRLDAENLRPILKDNPQALAELDAYQANRRRVRTFAYIGSIGLFSALGAAILGRGKSVEEGRPYRLISAGGLLLTATSGVFAYGILTGNESHVRKAVEIYNEKRPDRRIELQLSARF